VLPLPTAEYRSRRPRAAAAAAVHVLAADDVARGVHVLCMRLCPADGSTSATRRPPAAETDDARPSELMPATDREARTTTSS